MQVHSARKSGTSVRMNDTSLVFGDFRLDLSPLRLWHNGREKKLPMKPLKLLAMLMQNAGDLVSQDDIRNALWPDRTIDFSKSIHVHVRQIRKALDDDADHPRYIVTEPRQGYRFVAPIEQISRPRDWRAILPGRSRTYRPLLALALVVITSVAIFATMRTGPTDPADGLSGNARDVYLRGVYLLDGGHAQAALPLLAEAVLLAPDNASASAHLSRAFALSGDFDAARSYAQTALNLDPELAGAHEAMAHVLALADWQWSDARRHLETAYRLDPGHAPTLHGLASLDALSGNWESAHARMQQARRADPASTLLAADQGVFLFYAGRYEPALTAFRQALQLDPQNASAHVFAARTALYLDQPDTARPHIRQTMIARSVSGRDITQLLDHPDSSLSTAFHTWYLSQLDPADRDLIIFRAVHLAELGDTDMALSLFESAIANQDPYAPILALDPAFDPLRTDPRFLASYAELGL